MRFVAHRGYSKCYPDNSLEAFGASLDESELNPDIIGIELDIQFTLDEKIVVFHDTSIENRDGDSTKICDLTYREFSGILADTKGGLKACLFDEVLSFINHQTALYVEIKDNDYDNEIFLNSLTPLLDTYKPKSDIVLHTFSMELLEACIEKCSHLDLEYAFLFSDTNGLSQLNSDILSKLNYLHPSHGVLLDNVEMISDYGKELNVWTVNDEDLIKRIINDEELKLVRSIITDDLALAKWRCLGV